MMPLRLYFREYYAINRETFGLGRCRAAVDAGKLTWKVRKHRTPDTNSTSYQQLDDT